MRCFFAAFTAFFIVANVAGNCATPADSGAVTTTQSTNSQFLLTLTPLPGGSGIFTTNPSSVSGYFNPGTRVSITAVPEPGYQFAGFNIPGAGLTNPVTVTVNGPITVTANFTGSGSPLGFFPVTPCRLVDTRGLNGKSGAFGPPGLAAGVPRVFPLISDGCGLPGSAQAFSLNLTVVPSQPVPYLSAWPTGRPYPGVSTLNSTDASTIADAAIVPSGGGSITVLSGGNTDLIMDTNGYFAPPNGSELEFFPVAPCRIADTRRSQPFGGPFGPPSLAVNEQREFPLNVSACNVPTAARAYSLNLTAVPEGPLPYLSTWAAGQPYPGVSTLNSNDGATIANAAIVPAGNAGGAITVMAGGNTDLIIDMNGYFAPPADGFHFYAVIPCRVADTRSSQSFAGSFGPPSLVASVQRDFPIANSNCGIPSSARAYSLNMTVVPKGPLSFLSVWPAGQAFPNVSTLNSPKGTTLANAAIVPAGVDGAITVVAGNATDLIIDINGYFAP